MGGKATARTLFALAACAALVGFVFSLDRAVTLTGVVIGVFLLFLGFTAYPHIPAPSARRNGDGYGGGIYGDGSDDNDGDGGDGGGDSGGGGGDGGGGGGE